MKTLCTFLTVLFWVTVLLALLSLANNLRHAPAPGGDPRAAGYLVGLVLGAAVIPGVVYLIRYFVGKEMRKRAQP